MGRVWNYGRWVAGGLLFLVACIAGIAGIARSDEPLDVAPAPHAVGTMLPAAPGRPVAPMPSVPARPTAPAPSEIAAKPAATVVPPVPAAPLGTAASLPGIVSPPGALPSIPLVPGPMPPGPPPPMVAIPTVKPATQPPGAKSDAIPVAKTSDQPPRDTTRQPIDRLLMPTTPVTPNVVDAANQSSSVYFPTLGFSGNSSVLPRSGGNQEYETLEDRWRIGFPEWDRYGLGHPRVFDYPYRLGRWFDPYNQNVLKGDYPIIGQHTFFEVIGINSTLFEGRMIPTATTPFESTARPMTTDFFGRPGQFVFSNLTTVTFEMFHGDAAFKPKDWALRLTPAINANTLSVEELGVINPDVRKGTVRNRSWTTLQEWFVEYKLADLSPQYDFVSVRAGSQPFTSDFRGFIFSDVNRGIRLFGNYDGNRTQYNLAYFRQLEKDTNSQLNTFTDRDQDILIANIFRQDFLFPGYTASASFHYNNDAPAFKFDKNGFLVRPDPAGVFTPHRVEAYYLGFAGDGHIDRYNISHAFYWVFGRDSRNPIAGQPVSISAQLAALEFSYDRDWARFRVSGLYQSGDGNANNGHATGFDSILDNQNFGGPFSFWRRQRIPLFGVGLTNDQSQLANLRSSRIQGQSNFVNPGLWLINSGVDFDVTPRLRSINNANVLFFDKTNSLETFTFQSNIDRFIGVDLSSGFEYRPRLNNNAIFMGGLATLIPGAGFRDLYNKKDSKVPSLFSGFVQIILTF